jgi:hypothetical protein
VVENFVDGPILIVLDSIGYKMDGRDICRAVVPRQPHSQVSCNRVTECLDSLWEWKNYLFILRRQATLTNRKRHQPPSLRGGTTKQSREQFHPLDCFVPRSDAKRVKVPPE